MFLKFYETFQFGVIFIYFRQQDSIKNLLTCYSSLRIIMAFR